MYLLSGNTHTNGIDGLKVYHLVSKVSGKKCVCMGVYLSVYWLDQKVHSGLFVKKKKKKHKTQKLFSIVKPKQTF